MKSLSAIQDMNGTEAFELGESTDIYLSGRYMGIADFGDALTTAAMTADSFTLLAFKASRSFSTNEIGIPVTAVPLLGTHLIKFVIYEATQTNTPSQKLYESAAVPVVMAGYISIALNFTFNKSKRYWIGIRFNDGITVRTIPVGGLPSLGYNTATATAASTVLRRTLAFNTVAPSLWTIQASDFVSSAMPDIRMKIV